MAQKLRLPENVEKAFNTELTPATLADRIAAVVIEFEPKDYKGPRSHQIEDPEVERLPMYAYYHPQLFAAANDSTFKEFMEPKTSLYYSELIDRMLKLRFNPRNNADYYNFKHDLQMGYEGTRRHLQAETSRMSVNVQGRLLYDTHEGVEEMRPILSRLHQLYFANRRDEYDGAEAEGLIANFTRHLDSVHQLHVTNEGVANSLSKSELTKRLLLANAATYIGDAAIRIYQNAGRNGDADDTDALRWLSVQAYMLQEYEVLIEALAREPNKAA